jgi:hypothetical protein
LHKIQFYMKACNTFFLCCFHLTHLHFHNSQMFRFQLPLYPFQTLLRRVPLNENFIRWNEARERKNGGMRLRWWKEKRNIHYTISKLKESFPINSFQHISRRLNFSKGWMLETSFRSWKLSFAKTSRFLLKHWFTNFLKRIQMASLKFACFKLSLKSNQLSRKGFLLFPW